ARGVCKEGGVSSSLVLLLAPRGTRGGSEPAPGALRSSIAAGWWRGGGGTCLAPTFSALGSRPDRALRFRHANPIPRLHRVPRAALTRYSLRSRFGRRLLLLFILCSLIPMAALAVLSFGTVTRQLRQASLGRLEHTGRALASEITERLRFLQGDLGQVTRSTPCSV